MSAESGNLTLNADILHRSEIELKVFVEALAERLERAMPQRVQVERRRDGLFSKTVHIAKLSIQTDKAVYELAIDKGVTRASRAKVVRGVRISSSEMPMPDWLSQLKAEVETLADQQGLAGDTLLTFL